MEKLTKSEAMEVAIKQKEIQTVLQKRNVLDVEFKVHAGCEGVINILTDKPPSIEKQEQILEQERVVKT